MHTVRSCLLWLLNPHWKRDLSELGEQTNVLMYGKIRLGALESGLNTPCDARFKALGPHAYLDAEPSVSADRWFCGVLLTNAVL